MAANPHWKRAIGFGKRLSDPRVAGGAAIRGPTPLCSSPASAAAARRGVHASVYDKNPEDHVRPALVPDDVIGQLQPGKYWCPHPTTGVFGPPVADHEGRRGDPPAAASPGNGGRSSVLDQKAWFRPLEGVDAPPLA